MKSFTRACLIFSSIVITIGLVLAMIGALVGGGSVIATMFESGPFTIFWTDNHTYYSSDDLTTSSNEFDNIDELDIDLKYGQLDIVKSDGNTYKVDAENVIKDFTCENKDGKLIIKDNIKSGLNIKFGNDNYPTITLYIPENATFEKAEIDMGAGYVSSNNLNADELVIDVGAGQYEANSITAKEVNLSVGAGYLDINELVTDSIIMDCGTGRMEVCGKIAGDADIECGIGNIILSLENNQTDYNYKVDCGIGKVIIGDQSFGGVASEKEINNNAEHTIDIDCGVGSVDVEFDKSL